MYYWMLDEEAETVKWLDANFIPVTNQTVGTADTVIFQRSSAAPVLQNLKPGPWTFETIDRVARQDSVKSSVAREITNMTASAFAALSVTNPATLYLIPEE
jgi:hypothetical protein